MMMKILIIINAGKNIYKYFAIFLFSFLYVNLLFINY